MATKGEEMLALCGVCLSYAAPVGRVRALMDVTLSVAPGEFVALEGPSGCGKTTLLLCAGALLKPDTGTVAIEGEQVYAMDNGRRSALRAAKIGFVFQQFHLIPYLTVEENILAPSVAIPSPQARERARELIGHFNLADRAAHLPTQLSTGERQRTALARALLNHPKLILADEPTGNLDRENAAVVLEELARFARSGGAVLLVTHETTAAERAERRISMRAGRIVA